MFFGGFSTL